MTVKKISERTQRVHKEAVVIDMLVGLGPGDVKKLFGELVDAEVTAVNLTIPVPHEDLLTTIERISRFYKEMEHAENAKIAYSVSDIENAKKEGKVAGIIGTQSTESFEGNLDLIRVHHMMGFRVIQLAYDVQNYLGAGCIERVDHGLTDRGKQAVKELNRLGILIDISHCGNNTTIDAAKASKDPIAVTHGTPGALVNIPRGQSDKVIKAVAERGGVFGQVVLAPYCERNDRMGVRPTLSDWVDLIDYLVDLAGIDHIGIGSDINPCWTKVDYDEFWKEYADVLMPTRKVPLFEKKYVEGLDGIPDLINITEELLKRGYSDDETKKLLGGNWLRLLKEVWK